MITTIKKILRKQKTVGYQYIVFLTIEVDGNMTTIESHKLADKLENNISELENVYKAIVHVEPYEENESK